MVKYIELYTSYTSTYLQQITKGKKKRKEGKLPKIFFNKKQNKLKYTKPFKKNK